MDFLTSYEPLQSKGGAMGAASVHHLNIVWELTSERGEDERKYVKTGRGHESMSTCDFLSSITFSALRPNVNTGHRTTGAFKHNQMAWNHQQHVKTGHGWCCISKATFTERQKDGGHFPRLHTATCICRMLWMYVRVCPCCWQATIAVSKASSCLPRSSSQKKMVRWMCVFVSARGLMGTQ